jgi:YHS domain-containing protein
MKVDREKAVTAEHDGHTYYFCSEHCRSEFSGS